MDISAADAAGIRSKDTMLPELECACGLEKPQQLVHKRVDVLDEDIQALDLGGNNTNALCVGRRCARQGFEYHWKPWAESPIFRDASGRELETVTENFVAGILTTSLSPSTTVRWDPHHAVAAVKGGTEEKVDAGDEDYDAAEDSGREVERLPARESEMPSRIEEAEDVPDKDEEEAAQTAKLPPRRRTWKALAASPWWMSAICFWTAVWYAVHLNKKELTPHRVPCGYDADYRVYPCGALVSVSVPPKTCVIQDKWSSTRTPCVLVNITIGQGGRCMQTYGVIPIRKLVDKIRPSKPSQRLVDDKWSDVEQDAEGELRDGSWCENEPRLDSWGSLPHVLALEPMPTEEDDLTIELACEAPEAPPELDADRDEERRLDEEFEEEARPADNGHAPPADWRVDVFGARRVSPPPWSLRPPHIEPELWLIIGKVA